MKLDLPFPIHTVRVGLKGERKCCNNYILPNSVVQKIGTNEMYSAITEIVHECDSSEDQSLFFYNFNTSPIICLAK